MSRVRERSTAAGEPSVPTTTDTTGSRWRSASGTDDVRQTRVDEADSRNGMRLIDTSATSAPSAHRPYALGRSPHAMTPGSVALVWTGFSRTAVVDRTPGMARSSAKSVSGADGV